jgi:tRNA A-37 threonylcarbamoyl transferase component Bud32
VLAAYKKNYDGAEKVMKSLADIERRGRYRQRTAVG